jgi:2-polyprenyl-6-methoxyphenol hydroxylase-like FAD-dependent oxidoreductase
MSTIKDKKIAIIGGGPGGLTLARLLQQHGVEVKVYERDEHKDARAKGATLDLHKESGLAALLEAGLMEAFESNYRPGADKVRIIDKLGTIVLDEHLNADHETRRPEIDRGPLQTILLDSLQPGTVVWDSQFVALTPQNDGWKIEFKNGQSATADLVIAADGANSRIRPYITPIKPVYSGITCMEGLVYDAETACPGIHQLLKGGKIFAFGDEKSLIVSAKGDGSLAFYTGCKKDESWGKESGIDFSDKAQIISWFKEDYAGWDDQWLELFENASYGLILRPQYCVPLDQVWAPQANLTILGDAAHLMPPYAGEGVNMAMFDALELSRCLLSENYPDTLAAISVYEQQMRKRSAETAEITLESTAALHSLSAIDYFLDILGGH